MSVSIIAEEIEMSSAYVLVAFAVCILLMILFISKWKIHPVTSILVATIILAISIGTPWDKIEGIINKGMADTLKSIAIVIVLGCILGKVLEETGAAVSITKATVKLFGEKRVLWAILLASAILGIPIWADTVVILLIPIVSNLALQTNKSMMSYGTALYMGALVTASLVPPTPGPVAAAALSEGAQIINDVSGGTLDTELPHVVADHDCLYIVQHWRGWLVGSKGANPDQDTSVYEHGVLTDVHDELMRQVDGVLAAGVKPERIIIDPGLGFSKPGIEHNLPLLTGLETFRATGYPVLIGQSRKRFISAMLTGTGTAGADGPTMAQRDDVTAALSALSAEHGAWAVRVHDVAKSRAAVIAGNTWREYA